MYSSQSFSALEVGLSALEDDLNELPSDAGEITGGGVGIGDTRWNIDIALNDGVPVEEWVERLAVFLRE